VTADAGVHGTSTVTVTVTLTNVDEPPVFGAESYAFSVAENAASTTQVGTVTASDPEGGTVVYDITAGNTGGVFVVDALAGTLVVGAALDYETLATYTLTVRAIVQSDSPAATTTVTVTVTDVVDAPPPPANLAATPAATSLALSWDAVTGATKYQVDYRLAEAATWTTAADALTTTTATLAELTCATAYEVRVRAYGSGAGYAATWSAPSAALAATTGACSPPSFGAETYAFSVAENSAVATAVGTITATTTGGGAVTYAITAGNDAGALAINASTGALTVAGALDHETTPSLSLTVAARAGGSQVTTTATVTVTDVDEAPAFGSADYAFSVAEDAATDAAVGTVSATDPEDGDLTYAITAGNDADAFAINTGTGALTVAGALDYETTDDYTLTVTASDAGGLTATADVAITVTDVAFPPVFGEAGYAFSVAENSPAATAVGTVAATEPEGGAVTFKITAGNDAGLFALDAASGALTVAGALDHETTASVSLTVEATTADAATATVAVTVTVTDVDEAPAFGSATYTFSVAEDAAADAAVGTVAATDPEAGTLTYAITAGNDADAFAIAAGTGALTVAGTLDHETTDAYSLTVSASDAAGHTATATVAITVTDVIFPPVFGAASYSFSVAENAAVGAAVGTVAATEPEGGAVTYAITAGNDAGLVALDSGTGALTVAKALDHETTASLSLTVQASSGGGAATATVAVAVTVTNVDEPPVFGSASYAFSVVEFSSVGTAVGTVTATDPERGALTYAITAGNTAGAFALDTGTGALTVAKTLDRATASSYSLTLTASDAAGGTATATVAISVTSAGPRPVFGAASYAFSVAQTVAIGTRIGTVSATHPDGATVVYDITAGNDANHWAVDALAGHVVVGAQLNRATTASYTLTITASTGSGTPAATTTVTITVTSGS